MRWRQSRLRMLVADTRVPVRGGELLHQPHRHLDRAVEAQKLFDGVLDQVGIGVEQLQLVGMLQERADVVAGQASWRAVGAGCGRAGRS